MNAALRTGYLYVLILLATMAYGNSPQPQKPDLDTIFQEQIQTYVDALRSRNRLVVDRDRILVPQSLDETLFLQRVVDIARGVMNGNWGDRSTVEMDVPVHLGKAQVRFRMVLGRDGADGSVSSPEGADGVSVTDILEERPAVILVVAGGNGGASATQCYPGGRGGNASALSTSLGGAVFTLGGDAGRLGTLACDGPLPKKHWKLPPGGYSEARTTNCRSGLVAAKGGDGANGGRFVKADPNRGRLAIVPLAAQGGNGGAARADCDPREGQTTCKAIAIGGNGGHGTSATHNSIAPAAIRGAAGGLGGDAQAISCCGQEILDDTVIRQGDAVAIAGSGGHGGNGGNNILAAGGRGGNARRGGDATADALPGTNTSDATAISGSGGNGGNGGNSTILGGKGGNPGAGGAALAQSDCEGKETQVDGVEGQTGRDGSSKNEKAPRNQ